MIKAKLIVDDKEINVLRFNLSFKQGADKTGRPSQIPIFQNLNLTVETRKDINFTEWASSENQTKQIELHVYPVVIGGRIRKIKLYDAHLVYWDNNFSSTDNQPISERLKITSAGFEDSNSNGVYSSKWRVTFPQEEGQTKVVEDKKQLKIKTQIS